MKRNRFSAFVLFVMAGVLATICASGHAMAQQGGAPPEGVTIAPIRSEWPLVREASGLWEVIGEVVVENSGSEIQKIVWLKLVVFDARGNVLAKSTYQEESFRDMLVIATRTPEGLLIPKSPGTRELAPGDLGCGFVYALAEKMATPAYAQVTMGLYNGEQLRADIPLYEFDPGQRTIWPLRLGEGDWVAVNTPGTYTHWQALFIPAIGKYFISQRFAIDAIQADPQGATSYPPNSPRKEDYYAWGKDILSSGSGTVVDVVTGFPDLEIGTMDPFNPAGNYVVIRHRPGLYSLYAHLMNNSATVRVGDVVAAGQVIGKVGNSGNTTEPHLHFHYVGAWDRGYGPYALFAGQGLPALFWDAGVNRLSTGDLRRISAPLPATWDARVNRSGGTYFFDGSTPREYDLIITQ